MYTRVPASPQRVSLDLARCGPCVDQRRGVSGVHATGAKPWASMPAHDDCRIRFYPHEGAAARVAQEDNEPHADHAHRACARDRPAVARLHLLASPRTEHTGQATIPVPRDDRGHRRRGDLRCWRARPWRRRVRPYARVLASDRTGHNSSSTPASTCPTSTSWWASGWSRC